jgi:hypothetical protein
VPSFFSVKLSNIATTTHGKLQQAFGGGGTSRAKPFSRTKSFLKAETLLKMSSAVDNHQQNGQVTTQHI